MKLVILKMPNHKTTAPLIEALKKSQLRVFGVSLNQKRTVVRVVMAASLFKEHEAKIDRLPKAQAQVFWVDTEQIDKDAERRLRRGQDPAEVGNWVRGRVKAIKRSEYRPMCKEISVSNVKDWYGELKYTVYRVDRVDDSGKEAKD